MIDTINVLKSSSLFANISDLEITELIEFTRDRIVNKNTQVISEGEESSAIFFIKEGSVNVTVSNKDGKEMILNSLYRGDHFGELSLLDGKPRSTNIFTTQKCEFIIISREDFYQFLSDHHTVAINIIKYLCSQVRYITKNVESLALMDVYGRLTRLLVGLSETNDNGDTIVEIPLTHREIALRVGSSREMISRILKELEKGGYLFIEHKRITIKKKLPLAW